MKNKDSVEPQAPVEQRDSVRKKSAVLTAINTIEV